VEISIRMLKVKSPPPTILVVDDAVGIGATYQRLLGQLGCRVIQARSRPTALTLLRALRLNLVIVEPSLREGDDFEAVYAASPIQFLS
jgi:CheY-like chemotaxis protein